MIFADAIDTRPLWPVLRLSTKATHAPVTVAQAKRAAGYDSDELDGDFADWIAAATEAVEEDCERALMTQTWKAYFPAFQPALRLPKPPVSSITSIEYIDEAGDTQTLSTSVYQSNLFSTPPVIREAYGQCWPSTRCDIENAVTVMFVAGYGEAYAVPERAKQAILVRVKRLFDGCGGDMSEDLVYQGLISGLRWRLA